ncbi:LuxR C-terminal-related transcriptional regulator [Cupriavidus sp. 8B]
MAQCLPIYVFRGAKNKQIAAELGIGDITVKVHCASAMRKMRASSLPDIVRKAHLIGLTPDSDDRLPDHFVPNRRINDM